MILKYSSALKKFKKEAGQANHFLITIMVGLDGIIDHNVDIKKEFHASWNPKNKIHSVERSKEFAKKSALAWMVDCLDMYLRLINKAPSLIIDTSLKNDIDSQENSRSVYKRINIISDFFEIQTINYAFVDLLICWRNRLMHYQAQNDLLKSSLCILDEYKDFINTAYCGLNVDTMIESFHKSEYPKFKEVAAWIRATINFVYEIDKKLIDNISLLNYADMILIEYFSQNEKIRLDKIFSKDQKRIEKSLRQVLLQNGFCDEGKNEIDEMCLALSKLTYGEAKLKYNGGTFIN